MKKIIKLTETELKNIVKKTINELDKIHVSPYTLQISGGGNISVIANNKKYTYKLYKVTSVFGLEKDLPLSVVDFPTQNQMKVSVYGMERTINIDKQSVSNFIKKNLGKQSMKTTFGEHNVKFVKV